MVKSAADKIRVLALCGFTQNAFIYSKQLGAIRRTCKDVEFVFLEPPIVVEKADMPWNANTNEFNSDATVEEEVQTPETIPRAWYLSTDDKKTYSRVDETLTYVHSYLVENGPFDGVMGFSQGACVAATLGALLAKPGLHPSWPPEPSIPQFKFVISVGGFLPAAKSPDFSSYFPLPASIPTLHVVGRNDTVVPPERARTLWEKCENSRVEYHEGGHFTPSKAAWRHFFNAYITSFLPGGAQGQVPAVHTFGPASNPSTPMTGSGFNTPRTSSPPPSSVQP